MAGVEAYTGAGYVLPDRTAKSVLDIDFEQLALEGKTDVFLDLDLTLRKSRHEQCDIATVEFLHTQRSAENITSLTIATNSLSDVSSCARQIGASVMQPFRLNGELVRKPDVRFFEAALWQAGVQPENSVMIGDRYQLDVVGAKRTGMHSILVEPMGQDYLLDILKRTRSKDNNALKLARIALEGEGSRLADIFEERLESAKPILFGLAKQLIESGNHDKWDLLIGDDTSGRLLTRFVRKILEMSGNDIPTRYVCSSRTMQKDLEPASFDAYIRSLAAIHPAPRHPLVVSERAGTGETLAFLEDHLAKYFDTVDFAVGAVRYPGKLSLKGSTIIGGAGPRASRTISATFERLGDNNTERALVTLTDSLVPFAIRSWMRGTQKTLKSTNEISASGLITPPNLLPTDAPLAALDMRRDARVIASRSYHLIDELAEEFYDGRKK